MLALLGRISLAFGSQRRLIRRLAALCLVLMGVHLCADHLDDLAYTVLDALDLWADESAERFLAWLAAAGGMSAEDAARASESFALAIDLAEKDRMALWLALLVELALDLLLLDLSWGRHEDSRAQGLLAELKESGRAMIDALSPLDLERLAAMPTLLAFALGGALLSALAVENAARDLIGRFAPEFLWGGAAAAFTGIVAAAVLLWRFSPDLLHGALLRASTRGDRARERAKQRLAAPHRWPRLQRAGSMLRLGTRGAWLLALALPLAVAGLQGHDLLALVARATPAP
ncbi:MAG: hypothetical protein IT382_24295 [Deltaproteobacteria bacterium]|nr:hypothetical protein [Deltaproteobacteria bacterium]